jgi:hypothetical protein
MLEEFVISENNIGEYIMQCCLLFTFLNFSHSFSYASFSSLLYDPIHSQSSFYDYFIFCLYNTTEELPITIASMANLKILKLTNNKLKTLPYELADVLTLEVLDCANNPQLGEE